MDPLNSRCRDKRKMLSGMQFLGQKDQGSWRLEFDKVVGVLGALPLSNARRSYNENFDGSREIFLKLK